MAVRQSADCPLDPEAFLRDTPRVLTAALVQFLTCLRQREGCHLAEMLSLVLCFLNVLKDDWPAGLDIILLLYISLLGSAASYGVFFYNASKGNLTALSSLTFLTPMFAAGCGFLFLGEGLTPLQLGGATVTLGAVALLNSGQNNT